MSDRRSVRIGKSFWPIRAGSTRRSRSRGWRRSTAPKSLPSRSTWGRDSELNRSASARMATGAIALPRARCARGVCARLRPAGAAGGRALRGAVSAGHRPRPAADREEARRDRRRWRTRRPLPTDARARATTRCGSTCRRGRSIRRSRVIAPARDWDMTRPEEIDYARSADIPVPATKASPYSTDENLWGRSIECGVLEDPWAEPPDDIYTLTKSPRARARRARRTSRSSSSSGVPTAVNGVAMPLTELIGSLETIAGAHGVGRIDMVENRLVGIKSREIYEAPAARRAAHRAPRARRARHPPGSPAPQAAALAGLRRPGLQRALVHPDARGHRRVRAQRASSASRAPSA